MKRPTLIDQIADLDDVDSIYIYTYHETHRRYAVIFWRWGEITDFYVDYLSE